MVWFQCEDCGENLKKPKLPNHFRICSAFKLSCIDCGETFSQQSVQGHNQCISEAEKYGPKGVQGKVPNATPGKPNKEEQPGFDIRVGLSNRPPWFCSLCNTKATSEQTLLLHAEGKKHKAKARAVLRSQQAEQSTPQTVASKEKPPLGNATNIEEEQKTQHSTETGVVNGKSEADNNNNNGNVSETKKRKRDGSENDDTNKQKGHEGGEVGNGEVIQSDKAGKKVHWKKLIKSTLKANPDGSMKMKKLRKHVAKSIKESGAVVEEATLDDTLQQKIGSSSKFTIDGKYVRLVKKN